MCATDAKQIGKERKEREFDIDRVAEECDFETDKRDRRILYEIAGIKLFPAEFIDDTTGSDEEEAGEEEFDGQAAEESLLSGKSPQVDEQHRIN